MELRLRGAIRALNQADGAVYPVDAHGLAPGPENNPWHAGHYRPDLTPLWPGEVWILDMSYWAEHTGGRAFFYTNGLSGAIRKAADDSEETYTLGYYPSDVRPNGEFHQIRVLVGRKHLTLRYHRGYYATATTPNANADPIRSLEAAAASPLDSTGIGVTARVVPIGKPVSQQFAVTVYIEARGLTLLPEKGGYDASFMIWAGQHSPQGDRLGAKSKTISVKLDEAGYRTALAGGLGAIIQDAVKPGAWQLRIAVRHTASGAIGSVIVPLRDVPGFHGG